MGGRFIASTWDPHYIIGQIVCMQSMFYFVLGLLLITFDMCFGVPFSLDQIFLPYSASSKVEFIFKWATISAYFVSALVCSVGLVFVVGKAKKCADFACTIYIYHVLFSAVYSKLRMGSISWWLTMVGCGFITSFVGEFLCMKKEMQEIPISSKARDPTP